MTKRHDGDRKCHVKLWLKKYRAANQKSKIKIKIERQASFNKRTIFTFAQSIGFFGQWNLFSNWVFLLYFTILVCVCFSVNCSFCLVGLLDLLLLQIVGLLLLVFVAVLMLLFFLFFEYIYSPTSDSFLRINWKVTIERQHSQQ